MNNISTYCVSMCIYIDITIHNSLQLERNIHIYLVHAHICVYNIYICTWCHRMDPFKIAIQTGKQSKTICKPITQHYLKLYIVNITKLKWQSTFLLFDIAMEHHHF